MQTAVIVTERQDLDAWPAGRRTDEVIAERMLAAALYDYHIVTTKPKASLQDFRTWDQLTDTQKHFLVDYAIPAAMQAIWSGR